PQPNTDRFGLHAFVLGSGLHAHATANPRGGPVVVAATQEPVQMDRALSSIGVVDRAGGAGGVVIEATRPLRHRADAPGAAAPGRRRVGSATLSLHLRPAATLPVADAVDAGVGRGGVLSTHLSQPAPMG